MKGITYTDEFKRIFIASHQNGEFPKAIFGKHGFDIDIIGMDRVDTASKRWRAAYRKKGIREDQVIKQLSIEEKYSHHLQFKTHSKNHEKI
jgi:transposase